MKIQELYINNFKSLVDFKLVTPNSFSVFVGPNGAGKSNIFEALEYVNCNYRFGWSTADHMFGGVRDYLNCNSTVKNHSGRKGLTCKINFLEAIDIQTLDFDCDFQDNEIAVFSGVTRIFSPEKLQDLEKSDSNFFQVLNQFYNRFSRLFVRTGNKKLNTDDNSRLSANADNLEKVLKRLLHDATKREEILDWLRLFVPELENIEVHSDNIGGTDTLLVREKNIEKPLRKNLISDGTYNILALLTAIYQSDEPQFLCIEEPENGLNPYVVKELVNLCREACEKMGHTIWLNTHSPTLVAELKPEELILIDKKDGITRAKQFTQEEKLFGLSIDEAWLSNALGGGLPW